MAEETSPHNQEALDELCRLLRFSQGEFTLILAVCNSTRHRQELVKELRQQCSIPFDEITLAPTASTLFTTVNAYIKDAAKTPPEALMVYGLSEVEDPEQLLTATNQIREEFREFTFPLVLWLTDNDQKHLIRTAPDFYTWANPITFETPSSFFLSFIDELIEHVWQQVTQSQENRFLTTQELGLTANSANYRELETSLAVLAKQDFQLPPDQAANLEFVRGRIANNNEAAAREHYAYSLETWKTLVLGENDEPKWQEKMGHVQFYLGLWWRNHAERHRPDFELAFGEARKYFAAAIETLEGIEESSAENVNSENLEPLSPDQDLVSPLRRGTDRGLLESSTSDQNPSAFGTSPSTTPLAHARRAIGEETASVETLSKGEILAARYINYLAESLHRLERWPELETVATKARAWHQQLNHPFRVARAEGFLAEVALAREDWATGQQHAETALALIQSADVTEKSKQDADFYNWINSFHRGWYLFSLGKAQFQQQDIDAATETLEQARRISQPDYDPKLYSLILAQLQRCYFQQGLYLPAFETRRQRDAIDSRFNYRAFVGAGRLQPKQQIANPALPTEDNRKDAIVASGRKQDVQKLVKRLSQDEYVLTIVYGPSGVGKSSLIEAGLMPALEQERIETRRVVPVYLRRYRNWVEDLVQLLTELESGISAYRSNIFNYPQDLLDEDKDSSPENTALPEKVLRRLKHHTQKNQVMVLVFDQFEEFFFEFEQTAERRAFYDFLGTCLGMPYVKVVLSLREDYIHYLLGCDRLTNLDIVDNNILDKKWLYYLGNFKPDETKTIFNDLTYPTPYKPEQELVEKVVNDLAAGAGEVRPIELQIIGAQLQAEGIITPEGYYNWGDPELPTKELLVQKYVRDIVDECGSQKHQDLAEMVLYLLTNEKGTRPLKTKSDLASDLKTITNQTDWDRDLLSLILKILTESGLVTEVPEAPEERYQLVHDYLATLIRSFQQPLIARIEEEQKKRVTAEKRQIEEQKKRLEAERRQRKIAQRAAAGLAAIALLAICSGGIAWVQRRRAIKGETEANLLASSFAMEAFLDGGFERDAVVTALRVGQDLQSHSQTTNQFRALAAIRKVVYNVQERERLLGHNGPVRSVTFSPDGQTIASASKDNTVKLWNKSGEDFKTLEGHDGPVWSIAFSPDGKTIVTTSDDNTIKLWNIDGENLKTLEGHNGSVRNVAFSPDGQTIASASKDKTIKLWNIDGKNLKTLKGHDGPVWSVAFSPDGQTIASASNDRTVKLWNMDGENVETLKEHSAIVLSVAFSPDGQTIASASNDKTVKLWNMDGENVKTLKGHSASVWDAAFSLDGQTILSASSDNTIKLWNIDGENVKTLKGHSATVRSVAFSPKDEIFASASSDSTIKLWETNKDNREDLKLFKGHNAPIWSVIFSPDGETIVSASDDRTIKLWDKDGKTLGILKDHSESVLSAAFSPDGETIASSSSDKTIKLWSRNGENLKTFKVHDAPVWGVAFSPDGYTLASASDDNTVKLWNIDGENLKTLKGHDAPVLSVAFSPDGHTLASASDDNTVKLWSSIDGEELTTLEGHSDSVWSVVFSPNGYTLASASDDNTVKLWNIDGENLKTLKGHDAPVLSVAFSPDGYTLASASDDNTVKLWSSIDGEELTTLEGHSDSVWSVAFSPDGYTLASASDDNTIRMWNFQLDNLINKGCDWIETYILRQSPDLLLDLNACQAYHPDWLRVASPELIAQADNYLLQGKSQSLALKWYQKAQEWDNRFHFSPTSRLKKILDFRESIQFLEEGKIQPAIQSFYAINSLEPALEQTIWEVEESWERLCYQGSLKGQAQDVLFACEAAVERVPFRYSNIRNRGLAYALTDKTEAAIADFEVAIARTTNADDKAKIQDWIEMLKNNNSQFTPEILKSR
ncbi:NACHT and WD repeat domain-containing protein [Leptothoe spongobia]|uniref:AAA family ATPase n=1 Tax=Leptothoe spongobia TAU-MAC 1115 TaxID=1967444 RepID=A0A947DEI9_9CYAN|nr:AAA family ATPase [Leptothoe spongobia]MBT9315300.1 AAA family ATPase [Leptothoe spongobia TAU-MAC 1115]